VSGVFVVLHSSKLSVLQGLSLSGHREAFWRITIPGQEGDAPDDQGSAKVLTFDLSIPLLKRLISGSQSLYRQVQQDALGFSMPIEYQRSEFCD
jgi:hypothetical protein